MKITIFTGNQPRHISLIESMSKIAEKVYAIQECDTVFPGRVDDFYRKSEVMQKYFTKVIEAEKEVFGGIRFTSSNVTQLVLKSGDLNMVDLSFFKPSFESDLFIVFGSSYIKAPLIDILLEKGAINVHMGVSPYYRGNSCNFWALYDGNPELVGATIHRLGKGLDSGDILYHVFPPVKDMDGFTLGMLAVKSAHESLAQNIKDDRLWTYKPSVQNKKKEIRYTRNRDFTDEVAGKYLDNLPNPNFIRDKCLKRDLEKFINPYVPKDATL